MNKLEKEIRERFLANMEKITPTLPNVELTKQRGSRLKYMSPIFAACAVLVVALGIAIFRSPLINSNCCAVDDGDELVKFEDYQSFTSRISEIDSSNSDAPAFLTFDPIDSTFDGSYIDDYYFRLYEVGSDSISIREASLYLFMTSVEGYHIEFKKIGAVITFQRISLEALGNYTDILWNEDASNRYRSTWEFNAVGSEGDSTMLFQLEFCMFVDTTETEIYGPELWDDPAFESIREVLEEVFTSAYLTD